MIYSPDELRELIPLYLNHQLSEKERKKFEEALNQYPELKNELKEFSEIKGIYKEIEKDIPPPSETLYQRVLSQLQLEAKPSRVSPKRDYWAEVQRFFKSLFSSPRVPWGIVAVQFAVILLLLIFLPREDHFRTLTSRQPLPGEGIKINVIFDKGSTEKEIRELLNRVGATIVIGPSLEGLYIIEVKEGQDVERVLKDLKKTGIVKFAEKAY